MRSLHLLALTAAVAAAGTACGGDNGNGGGGPSNEDPVADFTFACDEARLCTFTDASTDDGDIASYSWNFGDNTAAVTTEDASHTYQADDTYNVTLTVTDDEGADASVTKPVAVAGTGTTNQPPVAGFTSSCTSADCTFTNTSTDADGTFSSSWNFGDNSALVTETSPTHSYAVTELTPFTVTLTVTDDDGATATSTQVINVAPPASLTCGTEADCSLDIEAASTVTVTLVSSDCELRGNTFEVTIIPPDGGTPAEETLFTDGCSQRENPPGTTYQLQTGAVLAAGTEIKARIISGGTTLELPPAVRVTGSFLEGWTLEFDDGAQAEPPEPDFNDLVIRVEATPAL